MSQEDIEIVRDQFDQVKNSILDIEERAAMTKRKIMRILGEVQAKIDEMNGETGKFN